MPLTKVQSRGTENVGQGSSNLLINGAMTVSQRGTSQAFAHDGTTNTFLIDRWRFAINNTDELDGTFAQVDDDPLGGDGKALKWTTGTAESAIASDEYGYFTQKIEAQNLHHIQNGNANAETLTLSFYVKSSITGTFSVGLYKPDNTARLFNKTYTINSANTWEKKTVTFVGDTSGGGINNDTGEGFWVSWHLFAGSDYKGGGSTSGWTDYANNKWADGQATDAVATTASATWLMTQCQLEVGSQASDFQHEDIATTIEKCERYFQKSYELAEFAGGSVYNGTGTYLGNIIATSNYNTQYNQQLYHHHDFRTRMRADPAITFYNPYLGTSGGLMHQPSGTNHTASAGQQSEIGFRLYGSSLSSTGNNNGGDHYAVHFTADDEL